MSGPTASWSVGSLISSLRSSLPSPSGIVSNLRSIIPGVSFTAADGTPRYGLIALTAGVAAGAGYFVLRSSFGGNNHYPYHLIAGADSGPQPATDGVGRQAVESTLQQNEMRPEQQSAPPVALSSSHHQQPHAVRSSGTFSSDPLTQLTVTAFMIVLVLISVSLATSLHKNGISRGIRFWQWYDSFPLFLPLFFTAAGIALHQLGVPQQQQPQRKLQPPVKAKNISPKQENYVAYSGGESKNSSGETIVYADESKGGDGSVDNGTNTSLQEEDAFAALDAMWQESEAGGITKTELLHAVIAEIEQTSAGEGVPASTSAEHLWRAARALSNLASWEPTLDPEEKKKYVVRGLDFAERAVMQATKNSASLLCQANATKFLAILQGQSTAFLGTKEGMVLADEIRKNMEKALKLNPLDPMLHYMLAVWKYNVAEVPYGIRYAASWVSGVLLEADFESALVDVEKALELGGSDFYVDIHVMYARLQMKIGGKGSKTLAVASLEKACSLKVVSPSDKQIKGKAERLLWKAKRD